ncbi:hypothetical protein Bca52824_023702 [Brassica carinata]|uniref:Ubiquitin-like protease family profile domain-containing protein n=1 Tax=Brassica carinata TaxID=52824 RepID=A0A8X8ATD8_BRACI|nr:hypothetical protein Bca52824_023702 [Brassica carinata]
MNELGLPLRMFEAGSEPTGRKRVNNYFNLRWIDIIKSAFRGRRQANMGSHTFSVMFLHYCLSRQLITAKEYELWWIFVGKPIRYAIQDFALVTGLNCGDGVGLTGEAEKGIGRGKASGKGKSSMSIWDDLFRGEEKPTPGWIMERLVKGKKYKDELTRLRLSLLVLVEGILCPTCGTTKIRPEVYPWGRESFLLTVKSTKARSAVNYVKDTMTIQGFTHAMVLVTVTACPSIIIKTGGADPLADSTLSSEEIIRRVVERKLVVNIVSAKTVDELGQAYVRSLISSDEEGEDLYRGLGDKEDMSVDTVVALIDDDYPFEHNTWSGGVKADEVKLKKGHVQTSESSDENVPDPVEKDNVHHGGVESGGYSGDPRGQSSANPSGAPLGGDRFHFDVRSLLRRAADAYEEKVIAMFEGYILSLKGHFNSEVGGLRTDLQSSTSAIGQLESKVTGEFEKINQLLKSRFRDDDMEPTYGFSPQSQFPGQDDDFNNSEVNPDRPTTHTGATDGVGTHKEFVSTQRDVEDVAATGTASVGLDANLDEGERGGGRIISGAETGGEDKGADHSGHDPINVEPSSSVNVASPSNVDAPVSASLQGTSACSVEEQEGPANPPSRVDVDPVNVSSECPIDDPVSGLVNKILSDAGVDKEPLRPSTGSGTVNLGSTDVPHTSSDVIPEKMGIDGVHDDRGEDVVGKKAGRVNTDAAGGQADGGRRLSTRTHTSPKRYTPPAPTVRKKEGNKKVPRRMDDNAPRLKRVKKLSVEPSNPKPPTQEKATFIGGFSTFTPPTPAAREVFLKKMAEAKSNAPSLGSVISIASLDDMFNCTSAVDRVVGWIRKRRDSNLSSKFDFIPPTFFMELLRSYHGFEAMQDKDAFTFPKSLRIDFLYTLMLVKDRHWVGMIVDFPMWAIYVVDANQTCLPTSVVKDVLKPISIMMPHMISRFCLTSRPCELNYLPFPMSSLDIPVLLEHPGYSAVVALILLEISAVGKPLIDLSLTEEEVYVAAENYAISTLAMF